MIEDGENLLFRLGEQLELADAPATQIAVCGGTALNVLGLVSRTTKDIDILGRIRNGRVVESNLPDVFWRSARIVAEEFELERDWINTGPSPMVRLGLPEGLEERLVFTQFGEKLSVGFISRYDQIHFKLWVAADGGPNSYHVGDLVKLKPNESEIENAAGWCIKKDPSDAFLIVITDMLKRIGFDSVARKL